MRFLDIYKPIIGVVHLKPLPGAPGYHGSFEEIIESALSDATKLVEGGVDALIVENYGDKPYKIRVREVETLASIAIITREIIKSVNVPVGVSILRNSGPEALCIAEVSGAKFIRVNGYCEVLVSPEGIIEPVAREVLEVKRKLFSNVMICADINVKHAKPLVDMNAEDVIRDCCERCKADALIVTGERTGLEPTPQAVLKVKKISTVPVLVGSGMTTDNIDRYVNIADGFIIGSYFKVKGKTENPVSLSRVEKFIKHYKRLIKERV